MQRPDGWTSGQGSNVHNSGKNQRPPFVQSRRSFGSRQRNDLKSSDGPYPLPWREKRSPELHRKTLHACSSIPGQRSKDRTVTHGGMAGNAHPRRTPLMDRKIPPVLLTSPHRGRVRRYHGKQ